MADLALAPMILSGADSCGADPAGAGSGTAYWHCRKCGKWSWMQRTRCWECGARRPKPAAQRRGQYRRAQGRTIQNLLISFDEVLHHRGGNLNKLAAALHTALSAGDVDADGVPCGDDASVHWGNVAPSPDQVPPTKLADTNGGDIADLDVDNGAIMGNSGSGASHGDDSWRDAQVEAKLVAAHTLAHKHLKRALDSARLCRQVVDIAYISEEDCDKLCQDPYLSLLAVGRSIDSAVSFVTTGLGEVDDANTAVAKLCVTRGRLRDAHAAALQIRSIGETLPRRHINASGRSELDGVFICGDTLVVSINAGIDEVETQLSSSGYVG